MSASKYILIIMATFTFYWLPWIVLHSGDVIYHISGSFEVSAIINKWFQSRLYQGRTSGCACILACIHGAAYVELPKLPNDIDG